MNSITSNILTSFQSKYRRFLQLRPLASAAVRSLEAAWDVRMVYELNCLEGASLSMRETELAFQGESTSPGKSLQEYANARDLWKAWTTTKKLADSAPSLTEAIAKEIRRSFPEPLVRSGWDNMLIQGAAAIHGANHGSNNSLEEPELMGAIFDGVSAINCPIERAARLHLRIRAQQIFGPRNQSMALLAMNFVLLAAGYPPISISPEDRADYYAALKSADSGNFPAWLAFLSTRVEQELDSWLAALDPSLSEN